MWVPETWDLVKTFFCIFLNSNYVDLLNIIFCQYTVFGYLNTYFWFFVLKVHMFKGICLFPEASVLNLCILKDLLYVNTFISQRICPEYISGFWWTSSYQMGRKCLLNHQLLFIQEKYSRHISATQPFGNMMGHIIECHWVPHIQCWKFYNSYQWPEQRRCFINWNTILQSLLKVSNLKNDFTYISSHFIFLFEIINRLEKGCTLLYDALIASCHI